MRTDKDSEQLKENCIVFESLWGRRYSCNPAAFYEYINENHPEYECVWLLNDTEVEIPGQAKKVKRGTDEHRHYMRTAKYFVYNNNMPRSFKKRDGQVIIHTMHGTPYKTYGLDVKEEIETEDKAIRVIERASMWDYLVVQGEFSKNMAWRWFRYDKSILETGYPRTDVLFRADNGRSEDIRLSLGLPIDKKVILYVPTWRDMDSFEMRLDIEELRAQLSEKYILLIRLHHFDADHYKIIEDGFVFDAGSVDKIEDLYGLADVLITDYSSVMFDFALTSKPMIFYAYDLEEYTCQDRGSYFDITTEAPGDVVVTTDELIRAINHPEESAADVATKIEAFKDKYMTYENSKSCEQIFEEVFVKQKHLRINGRREKTLNTLRRLLPGRIYSKIRRAQIKRKLYATTTR